MANVPKTSGLFIGRNLEVGTMTKSLEFRIDFTLTLLMKYISFQEFKMVIVSCVLLLAFGLLGCSASGKYSILLKG